MGKSARGTSVAPTQPGGSQFYGSQTADQVGLRGATLDRRRIEGVLEAVALQAGGSLADRLCSAAAARLGASGVGVSLGARDALLETVCATEGGREGESLQSDLGEGPSYSAHQFGWPVLVDDLKVDDSWPAFGPAAAGIGLHSIFAFPMRRGSVRIGAFTLYRQQAGELSSDHHADALVFARFAVDLFLALQSENPPDELDQLFVDGTSNTVEIHQASGIVAVQLGIAVGAALAMLRAHAYTEQRSLRAIADDVVARRLQMNDDR